MGIKVVVKENGNFLRFGWSWINRLYQNVILKYSDSAGAIIFISGGDEWKQLAEKLGMTYDEIRFLDKRTLNPCNVVLDLVANSRRLNVGEVYDILVECDLVGSADLL